MSEGSKRSRAEAAGTAGGKQGAPGRPARPWLAHYPPDVRWDKRYEGWPVPRLLERSAARWPEKVHLEFFGRSWRYRETWAEVRALAAGFQKRGLEKGDRVAIFLPNCPQYVITYYAVLLAGGIVVNSSPLYAAEELVHQLDDAKVRWLVTINISELLAKADAARRSGVVEEVIVTRLEDALPFPRNWLFRLFGGGRRAALPTGPGWLDWAALPADPAGLAPVAIDPKEDVAVLQYTGGTTGRPKGAMLTHANLTINAQQNRDFAPTARPGFEVMFGALPLFHVYAVTIVMNTATLLGAEIALMPKFELGPALKLIERRKVTILPGVPTMFAAMLESPLARRTDLSSVRLCLSGGAPMPAELKRRFEEHIPGLIINEGYGLTEASPSVSSNPTTGGGKPGSIGVPLPATDIAIADLDDPRRFLPLGETGEILVRGPQVMKGYWNAPEETAAAIVDGWLRTGDVGYMDEDGYSFIVDRAKDLILVGGFNVYPRVIEEALYRHPAVAEAAVIGVPDPRLGEVPKAFVVLRDGHGLTEDELKAFLKEQVGKHEMPRLIEFRDELPKTPVGKIWRRALAEEEGRR